MGSWGEPARVQTRILILPEGQPRGISRVKASIQELGPAPSAPFPCDLQGAVIYPHIPAKDAGEATMQLSRALPQRSIRLRGVPTLLLWKGAKTGAKEPFTAPASG